MLEQARRGLRFDRAKFRRDVADRAGEYCQKIRWIIAQSEGCRKRFCPIRSDYEIKSIGTERKDPIMPAASSPERRSRITIIVTLCLSVVLVSVVVVPSVGKRIVRHEQERLINAALSAISRDDPEALKIVLPHLKPETSRWHLVWEIAAHSGSGVATEDRAAVLPLLLETHGSKRDEPGDGIPLFLATFNGRVNIVQFLVQKGVDLNLRHPVDGATVLFSAVRNNNLPIAAIFLASGADPNIPLKALPYRRIMHMGPLPGSPPRTVGEYERRAKQLNDEIRTKNEGGTTPLMCAAYSGSVEMVRLLLKEGADPDRKTLSGKTAIDFARQFRQLAIVRLLKNSSTLGLR